jgi:hypothetical protein
MAMLVAKCPRITKRYINMTNIATLKLEKSLKLKAFMPLL